MSRSANGNTSRPTGLAAVPLRLLGDPVLRSPTNPVTEYDAHLSRLVHRMMATMYAADGVGLAANQIGVGLSVFVYDVGEGRYGHVVNPTLEIDASAEIEVGLEGCLSVPGEHFPTPRARRAVVRGVDVHGKPVEVRGEGLLSRCLQHEVDHLEGKLFLDRLTPQDRRVALAAYRSPSV
jgi:peptide deformylase